MAHRRSGKTTATINHLIRDAIQKPQTKYAFICPTYKQAKNIAWDILKEYARKVDGAEFNEAELRVDFKNGSRITLYGADYPDSLRGMGLWGVVFDEYSQQPSNIFTEIIRPALSDHQGYAIWIGTPKGKNEFYRLYEQAKKNEDWLSILLTANDTKIVPQTELEDAEKTMSPEEFRQEFMCSFDATIKGAYYAEQIAKARADGRIKIVPYDELIKVHTVWDLGVGDSTSIGFFQKVSNEVRLIDYYESSDKGLNHYIAYLDRKDYIYGKHFAPHDIQVRELSTGKSRLEIAKTLGITFEVLPIMAIEDGINAARLMWSRLWVDENRCQVFLDYISQYCKEWDDKHGMFKDRPRHDFTSHAADMLRYAAEAEKDFTNDELIEKQLQNFQRNNWRQNLNSTR